MSTVVDDLPSAARSTDPFAMDILRPVAVECAALTRMHGEVRDRIASGLPVPNEEEEKLTGKVNELNELNGSLGE